MLHSAIDDIQVLNDFSTFCSSSLSIPNTQKSSYRVGDTVSNITYYLKVMFIYVPGPNKVLVKLEKGLEKGVVKFVGITHFTAGDWVGIELDHCCGKTHVFTIFF